MKIKHLFLKISLSFILAALVALGYIYVYLNEYIEAPAVIMIEKGSNQKAIDALNEASIGTNIIDIAIIKYLGGAKSGAITTNGAGSRIELLKAIVAGKQKNITVTLIPSETTEVFLQNLAKKEGLSLEKLKAAYVRQTNQPEGRLYPETYSLPFDAGEEKIVTELLTYSKKEHAALQKKYSASGAEFDEKLIIASIIEKEAVNHQEMPIIASVIYNRLKINMPLQMDGALNYGLYSHQKVTPERIRTDESSYNTYKYRGLPRYPVCAPSKEAINAAFNPSNTDFLYFVKGVDGKHNFSNSYTEHKTNINDVKKSNR